MEKRLRHTERFVRYIRKLALTIVGLCVGVCTVIPIFVGGVSLIPLMIIYGGDTMREVLSFIPIPVLGVIMLAGAIIWFAAFVLLCGATGDYIVSKIINYSQRDKREKRVGIFAAWWKAHKERVCPLLEFYEGEKDEN